MGLCSEWEFMIKQHKEFEYKNRVNDLMEHQCVGG